MVGQPSGPQESLRHKVKVLEGSLLAGGEGPSRSRRGQSWWQPCELALKVAQVCWAAEGGHEGGLDRASEQGLPVGSLGTRAEVPEMVGTATPGVTPGLPHARHQGALWSKPLTLKNGCTLISSASCLPAPRRCSGHFWRSWAGGQVCIQVLYLSTVCPPQYPCDQCHRAPSMVARGTQAIAAVRPSPHPTVPTF